MHGSGKRHTNVTLPAHGRLLCDPRSSGKRAPRDTCPRSAGPRLSLMRIAFISEVFPPKVDGITNRLRHTLAELEAAGHECLVFAPRGSLAQLGRTRVVRIDGPPFPPYPGLRITLPDPRIAWELRRFAPDVVHAVGPACLGVWGLLAARALALPRVASYHTDLPRYLGGYGLSPLRRAIWPLIRSVHGLAHLNLCPSRFTRDELHAHGVPSMDLWRGGVDTRAFHPDRRSLAMRMRLTGGRPDGPLLLYVGRLSPEKNLSFFEGLLARIPQARLALVGDGPARPELERTLAPFVCRGRVQFAGFLHGDELASAFASADAFVMPSTTETLGFVVLEAMSSGLPVVAARAGGVPDLVRHEENGILFDPRRPDLAADEVRRLLASEGERRFYARAARKFACESSWRAETERLLDHYRRAMIVARQTRGGLRRLAELLVS